MPLIVANGMAYPVRCRARLLRTAAKIIARTADVRRRFVAGYCGATPYRRLFPRHRTVQPHPRADQGPRRAHGSVRRADADGGVLDRHRAAVCRLRTDSLRLARG